MEYRVEVSESADRDLDEGFLYQQYIKQELAKTKEMAEDPNTKWLTEEDVWDDFMETL